METKHNTHPTLGLQDIIPVLSMVISALMPALHGYVVYEKFETPGAPYPFWMNTTLIIQTVSMAIFTIVMCFRHSWRMLYHRLRILVLIVFFTLTNIFFWRIEINWINIIWGWLFLIFYFRHVYIIIYKPLPTIESEIRDAQTGH